MLSPKSSAFPVDAIVTKSIILTPLGFLPPLKRPLVWFERPLKKSLKDSYFLENGSFYIFGSSGFKKNNLRLYGKIGYYPMGKETYFDIDDLDDLKVAAKLIW